MVIRLLRRVGGHVSSYPGNAPLGPSAGDDREKVRLDAITALRLLDEPVGEAMADAIRLAAEVCGAPMAVVNIIDARWQHTIGPMTGSLPPIPREDSICRFVVDGGQELILGDARLDPRFTDNPYVDGSLAELRFYASVPLATRAGSVVGTLCAFDEQAHEVTALQVKILKALADQVMAVLELRQTAREAAEAAQTMAQAGQWAAEVLETSSDAYLAWDSEGIVFGWNRSAEELYGFAASEAIGRDLGELIVLETDLPSFRANLAAGRESPRAMRVTQLRKDHRTRMVDLVIWPSRSAEGWHAFARDVTDLVAAEQEQAAAEAARRQAESLLTIAFEHAPNGTAIVGVKGDERRRLLRVNPALVALTHRDDLPSADFASLLDTGGDDVLAEFDRLADGEQDQFEQVCRLRSGGGHIVVQALVALARDPEGRPEHAVAQIRDVTQQMAHELWLTQHATTDPLTGLANRLAMRERLVEEIDALRSGQGPLAVLLLDLDGFKEVNDRLGHLAGDDLLCTVAETLVAALPPDAMAARLGGDEFVMVVPRHDPALAANLAARLTNSVDDVGLEMTGQLPRQVTGSIGVATTVNPATAPEELIQAADRAMYQVKRRGQAP